MRVRVSSEWTSEERGAIGELILQHIDQLEVLRMYVTNADAEDLEIARTIDTSGLRHYIDRRLPQPLPVASATTPCANCTRIFDDHPNEECGEFEYL